VQIIFAPQIFMCCW